MGYTGQGPLEVANRVADFMEVPRFTAAMVDGLDAGDRNMFKYTLNSTRPDVEAAVAQLKAFYDKPVRDTMALLHSLGYPDFHDMVDELWS